MGEIVKVSRTLPAAKSAAKTGLAEISRTLSTFAPPLQTAADCQDDWQREGRSIGIKIFADEIVDPTPRVLQEAKNIHARWLRRYPDLCAARSALSRVLWPIQDRIDHASALRMLAQLFAALGLKKNDAENAMLLASAADIFSPLDGLIGGATRLWAPVSGHPLILALAIKKIIATAKFTSCAELREAMDEARHAISLRSWAVDYLENIVHRTDEILFDHDRATWEAHYSNVASAVPELMLPGSEGPGYYEDDDETPIPPSPRWTALDNIRQQKLASEQQAEPKLAACKSPPAKRTRAVRDQ